MEEELHSKGIYSNSNWPWKKTKLRKWKKLIKNKTRTTPKPHAHVQSVTKTSYMYSFKTIGKKTVRGVALTRYLFQ